MILFFYTMENNKENNSSNTSQTINTYTLQTKARQRFSLGTTSVLAENSEAVETLEDILKLLFKTWTVFSVSTLFNFYQEEVYLKKYAKKLREEVANRLTKENVAYKTKFLIMESISLRPSPMDPPPLKIEVYAKNIENEESLTKCIYEGIFLSWRTTKNALTTANSVRLPLLLCRGTKSAMGSVHNILSHMFDCMIVSLPIQEDDLIWLVPIIIIPINEQQPKNTDEIHMEYKIPEFPNTDTITIKFSILDLTKILKIIVKNQSDEASTEIFLSLEHIEEFRNVLYSQMLEIAGLQLGFCTLHKINHPAFAIMENRMKIMQTDAMNRVLLYLNEKALDTLHTVSTKL